METADHASGAAPITGQLLSASIIPQLLGKALARNNMVTNDIFGLQGEYWGQFTVSI